MTTASAASAPHWRSCASPRFALRYLDGDHCALAFDSASGDTHLLSLLDYELTQLLLDGARPEADLLAEVRAMLDAPEQEADLPALLNERLHHLRSLGLLDCHSP
ncbi:HPr-rel-A system PqqD family peptide chaperone [Paucibacter sp. APW11]|uniref:HPr-rel-A system PqqD family peptide chaperone n=1 Tax=Roseateles aquae TaxID=3077235 RepID=A0ABU3PE12_9BURK|nr:HPr-rel-A system PqqD family peptide chaperone [Paucibacter sp. APW11]MDT9000136.1 HPr-rel-A system PqqD family peptide chaperone [Paucibacter sp. APW11]